MPVLHSNGLDAPISLINCANKRYSEQILSQIFTVNPLKETDSEHSKYVTLQRNEIYFDGRKGVMLSVRDLSQQQNRFTSEVERQLLDHAGPILSGYIHAPMMSIIDRCSVIEHLKGVGKPELDLVKKIHASAYMAKYYSGLIIDEHSIRKQTFSLVGGEFNIKETMLKLVEHAKLSY